MGNDKIKQKVLVVDDEPANIFFLEGVLTEVGYDVCTAYNGTEALQKVNEYYPDVILLDIMMPDISGLDVLEKLINNPETCHIPVIMVTAKSEAEDVEFALSKGATEYIKKPVNETEMLARLKTVLRLKQQEDHLRELLHSKEEFINMVSHDVRAPFHSISGLAEMLLTDDDLNQKMSAENKEFLTLIINSSNFVIDYFNKLLNWSNLGAKELTLSKENVSLHKLINASKIMYSLKLEEKKQNFISECDENAQIFADVSYLQQVLNNLISNAIKYTPDGGSILVRVLSDNTRLLIKVIDTGIGISGISQEELFGAAFHKSTRGTKGEKGTGVGLRICKIITDAHGFGLTFNSESGKGAEFVISVPDSSITSI